MQNFEQDNRHLSKTVQNFEQPCSKLLSHISHIAEIIWVIFVILGIKWLGYPTLRKLLQSFEQFEQPLLLLLLSFYTELSIKKVLYKLIHP